MPALEACFQPIQIGNLVAKNRFVMAAMGMDWSEDGTVNQRLIDFFAERARGETGLIIVGALIVEPAGVGSNGLVLLDDDRCIDGLRRLAEAVRSNGSLCFGQLLHGGRYVRQCFSHLQAVAPTGGLCRLTGEVARTLSTIEVQALVEAYGEAARRLHQSGFDGVEIGASTGYLVNQFISPATNQREDKYGGDFENRMRFGLEIVERVKEKCGEQFPIIVRVCGREYVPGGLDEHDAQQIAARFAAAGAAAIDVQIGWHEAPVPTVAACVPRAGFADVAATIKAGVSVPVIGCNRINDPRVAEELLKSGKCDMVAMGRALMAEPYMVQKAREGRFDEILSCTTCGGCLNDVFMGLPVECSSNFLVGREAAYPIVPAAQTKRVVVVGGGPAGMEAARVAALRGHSVTLYEAEASLGGQLSLSVVPPHKEEMGNLLSYLTAQLSKNRVEVVLNRRLTADEVVALGADAVIVATGSKDALLPIPEQDGLDVCTAREVLSGRSVGAKAVVIGSGQVGCETALYLAKQGKNVTVVARRPRICADMGPATRWLLVAQLREAGVSAMTESKVVEITARGVVVLGEDGTRSTLAADSIVLAMGAKADAELALALEGRVAELYLVGDASTPRTVREAIAGAFRAAYSL